MGSVAAQTAAFSINTLAKEHPMSVRIRININTVSTYPYQYVSVSISITVSAFIT